MAVGARVAVAEAGRVVATLGKGEVSEAGVMVVGEEAGVTVVGEGGVAVVGGTEVSWCTPAIVHQCEAGCRSVAGLACRAA